MKKGTEKQKRTGREKLQEVMRKATSAGFKKYKVTSKWLDRKFRARFYYGVIFTKDFCQKVFGRSYEVHMKNMAVSADPLDYILTNT